MRNTPLKSGDKIRWRSALHSGWREATIISADDSASSPHKYDDAYLEVNVEGYGYATIHEKTDRAVIELVEADQRAVTSILLEDGRLFVVETYPQEVNDKDLYWIYYLKAKGFDISCGVDSISTIYCKSYTISPR